MKLKLFIMHRGVLSAWTGIFRYFVLRALTLCARNRFCVWWQITRDHGELLLGTDFTTNFSTNVTKRFLVPTSVFWLPTSNPNAFLKGILVASAVTFSSRFFSSPLIEIFRNRRVSTSPFTVGSTNSSPENKKKHQRRQMMRWKRRKAKSSGDGVTDEFNEAFRALVPSRRNLLKIEKF